MEVAQSERVILGLSPIVRCVVRCADLELDD
jgi:hypothetical protein